MSTNPSGANPLFGLRVLQPNEDPNLPPKRILNYKDGTELVYIPPGPFWMGDDELNEALGDCPRHEVYLDGYYMAVYPVTNKQYRRFMRDTGHRAPDESEAWVGGNLNPVYLEHPVVNVDWEDAVAYGRWANLRLPTEAEWEKAAGGPEGLKYPWGNEWEEDRCRHVGNGGEETTAEVKAYPGGTSVYGCEQLSGNVWEWCEEWYGREAYTTTERRNPRGPEAGSRRVVRGGSWYAFPPYLRVAARVWVEPSRRYAYQGFRLARSFP